MSNTESVLAGKPASVKNPLAVSGRETTPKDLTTLTFFLTDAYTRASVSALRRERRTWRVKREGMGYEGVR
jgi:hypothetical protein